MSSPIGTVLITGGTRGLGLAAAQRVRSLYPSHTLLVTGRDREQGAAAVKLIQQSSSSAAEGSVVFLSLDLLSQADVRRFAAEYSRAAYPPLVALILNAGMQTGKAPPRTRDGHAAVFAANHLNQFLLFHLLRPHFAAGVRVAVVASGVHDPAMKTGVPEPVYSTAEQLAHPLSVEDETGLVTYSTSKLCNVYFTYELDRRSRTAGQTPVQVNAMNPGLMPGTGLVRHSAVLNFLFVHILPYMLPALRFMMRTPDIHSTQTSAVALVRLALDPSGDVGAVSGRYFNNLVEVRSSDLSYNAGNAKDLWDTSVALTAKDGAERRFFSMQG